LITIWDYQAAGKFDKYCYDISGYLYLVCNLDFSQNTLISEDCDGWNGISLNVLIHPVPSRSITILYYLEIMQLFLIEFIDWNNKIRCDENPIVVKMVVML
jgi:hypothetical protein